MNTEDTQQFCLRWHNYQSSLLSTLPQLLDGDDLTDVTLCAGSRNIKAHRVVLSACSEYFKELFRELGPSHHPVIVLPGVEFTDLCALVTFMYSGEVNIYEPQLASLLTMADTLHIRGLADFTHKANYSPKAPRAKRPRTNEMQDIVSKLKTKQTSSLPETEVYDWNVNALNNTDLNAVAAAAAATDNIVQDLSKRIPPDNNNDPPGMVNQLDLNNQNDVKRIEYSSIKMESFNTHISETSNFEDAVPIPTDLTQGSIENLKPSKGAISKMYTTCFICGKQLSNHYNLRVHMETHQNVQYACNSCNHVSRSRDALRKHVSYRHPPPVAPPEAGNSNQQQSPQQQSQPKKQPATTTTVQM